MRLHFKRVYSIVNLSDKYRKTKILSCHIYKKTVFKEGLLLSDRKIELPGNSKREQHFNCGKKVE